MSCGRNRRRPELASTFNSQLRNQHEISSANTSSTEKIHKLSRSRKSNHPGNSSTQISCENPIEFDRFRILDDKGNDVTPRLITDYVRINIKNRCEDENLITEKQEPSISDKSIIGTTNLSTSTSHMFHTSTLFSAGEKVTTLDIGTRLILQSEQLLNKTHNDKISLTNNENQEFQAKFLPGLGLQWIDSLMDDILLTETETLFILNLDSHVISQEDYDEYGRTYKKNKIYMELCKNRQGNDLYIERGMQTFNDLPKHEHVITDPILIQSQQSWANTWDMYDSAVEAKQYDGYIYRQYLIDNNENLNNDRVKFNDHQHTKVEEKIISNESSKNSSTFFSQESLIKMMPSKTNCFELNDNNKNKLPEIDIDGFIMERILNSNRKYIKQKVSYDSTIKDSNNENLNKEDLLLIKNTNLYLEHLGHYSSDLTYHRNVSCLCWNKQNHDLLAVGYGKFQYNDDKEGLVCCWNTKNPEFPERYYQTDAGVTSLSFSNKHSNLLAVGLFNGNICIYDLNQNNTPPIVDTNHYDKKHTKPVWQLIWNERDRSSEIDNTEVLISISSDGRIIQWILRKEFEATELMHLKPYNPSKTTCQTLKRIDETYIIEHFSNFIGGLCFDIQSNDRTIYLCGTDEGVIHRCSTIYNEKYLESYIGHTSSVYKIHWSPFVENIFLSASADWTIRLWMIGYNQSCMIFPSLNSKIFFDAIWSPKSATMFFCVSENTIEIWDLSKSILDPIYVTHCSNHLTFTSIIYSTNSDCILVGTSDGTVWTYHLENFSSSANANDLIEIVQQSFLSQLNTLEKIDRHQDVPLITIK